MNVYIQFYKAKFKIRQITMLKKKEKEQIQVQIKATGYILCCCYGSSFILVAVDCANMHLTQRSRIHTHTHTELCN